MFDVGRAISDPRYAASARRAGDWLLTRQLPDGSFPDIDRGKPHVFDTGQVLFGLTRLWRETQRREYLVAASRAASWLGAIQEKDGSWIEGAYNGFAHTYYSRVGAALIEFGDVARDERAIDAGSRNLDWTVGKQSSNGFFECSAFTSTGPALLHTMIYVLEGLIIGYAFLHRRAWFEAVLKNADVLLQRCGDDIPFSWYNSAWGVETQDRCTTGLAQWAWVCLSLFKLTGESRFHNGALRALEFLGRYQLDGPSDIAGALPSSVPLWGSYGCMELYNWNIKYYLDALLLQASLELDRTEVIR